MNVNSKVSIHNRFDIQVHDIDGNLKSEAVGYNNVLDQMFTRLCGGLGYFAYIHFGTGTGTLSKTRTSLFNHLNTKAAQNVEQIKSIPVSSWKQKIVLNPEEFVGQTITEVGLAYGSASTNLVTHAMLKDAEGNQISITKGDTDVITIYATVFVTFDTSIPELVWLDMPNNNTLVNYLIGGAAAPTGSIGLNEMMNSYGRLGSTASVTWTSDIANKKRKTNVLRFGIDTANGNAKVLDFTNLFSVPLVLDGMFNGQHYENVSVGVGDGVTKKFKIPSRNIKHESVLAKLSGVLSTDYVLKNIPIYLDLKMPLNMSPYGGPIALSSDGLVLAIGTFTSSPYIKIFDRLENGWLVRPTPIGIAANVNSIALNSDGTVLAVGLGGMSPYVKVYDWNEIEWIERQIAPNLSSNGYAVALSADGLVLAVGFSTTSPYIKVYDWTGIEWIARAQPPNIAARGNSIALSMNGLVLVVGFDIELPYVKVYDWTGTEWIARPQPPNISARANTTSLSADGLVLAVGLLTNSPYVKTYDWTGTEWLERLQPPNIANRINSTALNEDGSILIIGAGNISPYAQIFNWTGDEWTELNQLNNLASNGYAVAISANGTVIAISSFSNSPYAKCYINTETYETEIEFTNPITYGTAITTDYTVDGLHKTDQFISDASFSIQFAEGE